MRGALVRSMLASAAAWGLVGMGAVGCGDDAATPPDAPVDARVDAAVDAPVDAPVDAAPFEEIAIAVLELHGNAAPNTPVMSAAVSIQATASTAGPPDYVQSVAALPFTCTASQYDLTPLGDGGVTKAPPQIGNLGTVTVTGFQFASNAFAQTYTTVTCTLGATGYTCDFPPGDFPPGTPLPGVFLEIPTEKHWLDVTLPNA